MGIFKSKNLKGISYVILLIIVLSYVFSVYFSNDAEPFYGVEDGYLTVHFLDVGQGDCAVVSTPDGSMLIDAGTSDSTESIIDYIDSVGITEFEYVIFTHPHADHIGGAVKIVEKYDIDTVIMPNAVSTSATYKRMISAIENKDCDVSVGEAGLSFTLGDATMEILAPVFDHKDLNNTSVVAKLSYKDASFIFAGDAEEESELAMLNRHYSALDADVLKAGHHGSSTSSCSEFVDAVSPEIVIYSCGLNNEYGHPHGETVSLMEEVGATAYRTDKDGTVVITTDGYSYSVYTEK